MTAPASYLSHARATLVLGLPLVGSNLAQMALHVTDTVMLGWYGVEALAAVVLGAAMFFIVFILGSGFAIASMGMVAAALGRGDERQVRRDVRMGMWLSILYAGLCLPLFWFSGPILRAMGQEDGVAALAQDYLRIVGWGMCPALLVMVMKSFLSAQQRAGIVLWATIGAALVNAGVNWVLIFGHLGFPEMGVRGAALASVFAQLLSLAVLVLYVRSRPATARFEIFARFWRPDWPAFRQVARTGIPVGLTGLAEGSLFNAAAVMMGWIGTVELAAHGIALEVAALAFMVHLGLSNAATVRVGHAQGSGDAIGLVRAAITAIALSLVFAAVMIAAFLLLPGQIIGLYLDADNPAAPAIVDFGVRLLAVAAVFQLFDALQCLALGLLRGVQDTAVPMWMATFSYWVIGIPASYVLAFHLGVGGTGLWWGLVVGLVCASVLLMARFWLRSPGAGNRLRAA